MFPNTCRRYCQCSSRRHGTIWLAIKQCPGWKYTAAFVGRSEQSWFPGDFRVIFNGTDADLSRPAMNYSMIVGRESCRYPLRLLKIFWYFGYYRIRQELSFIFFPFGDLFDSSTKAVAGKIQKLQNRTARVLTSASYDTSTDFSIG